MTLPSNFQFSQGSLQDYVNCPRRFQLRYIDRLSWPALQAKPALENERIMQQGATFHRMIHQYLLGVPEEDIENLIKSNKYLSHWWRSFIDDKKINTLLNNKSIARYPEITLSAVIGQHRLVAKYDLILIEPDQRAIIFDWKTSRKQPKQTWLAEKYQTLVYPFVLSQAGSQLNNGKPLAPEQITMVYWFANFPREPMRFTHSAIKNAKNKAKMAATIEEIQTINEDNFPLTDNEKLCCFCVYRSLCKRGVEAGPVDDFEDMNESNSFDFEIEFDQIAEIAY